jgi:uncharacterized protein with ATP-grasp and redox domains
LERSFIVLSAIELIMRTYFDCYPCFLRQALNAARRASASDKQQYVVLLKVLELLKTIQPDQSPPEIGYQVHRIVRETVDCPDPYRETKERSKREALALYLQLKEWVDRHEDALNMALRISISGNMIDFGPREKIENLAAEVYQAVHQSIYIDDSAILRTRLADAEHILFLGDNAGETVFDRVLIETLSVPVIYAVKGSPILNDATMTDALAAGLNHTARLIDNGSDAAGTNLGLRSDEFRRIFDLAPVIIAKGQANYETLSEAGDKVFCLLQVKCPIIAGDIGAPVGSLVVRQGRVGS